MDVSNNTGEDTQYRTGTGTTKTVTWRSLPAKKKISCPDPKSSWEIHFKLHDGKVLSAEFKEPMAAVALVKHGDRYEIVPEKIKKPVKPAKPVKAKTAA